VEPDEVGCCVVGAGGLYSGPGLAGLLGCFIPVFLGFFFSRPRLSRLPIICSSDGEM